MVALRRKVLLLLLFPGNSVASLVCTWKKVTSPPSSQHQGAFLSHLFNRELSSVSCCPQEDPLPLAFYVHDAEIVSSLGKTLESQTVETEKVVDIIYQPQAIFRVRAVARCTSSLEGHSEAVISVAFSPTGK